MVDGLDEEESDRHSPHPGRVVVGDLDLSSQIRVGRRIQELSVTENEAIAESLEPGEGILRQSLRRFQREEPSRVSGLSIGDMDQACTDTAVRSDDRGGQLFRSERSASFDQTAIQRRVVAKELDQEVRVASLTPPSPVVRRRLRDMARPILGCQPTASDFDEPRAARGLYPGAMVPERLAWLVAADAAPARLAERFVDAGFQLFLVGGSVRDALLDRPADDLDFSTDARPADIKRVIEPVADAVFTMGERFGTIGMRADGHTYEITTFRNEIYRDHSRKPEVTFSDDIETDLSRRDFTINAMALPLPNLELIDPFGGLDDLSRRALRTPLAPEIAFSDDPLRMMRLYRFASALDFEPDPAAVRAVEDMAERLEIVSAERIRDELSKLLVTDHPSRGLRGVVDSGLAQAFLPELVEFREQQDPLHRHKDVWEHTMAVVEKTQPTLRLRLAALLHDIGKPATRQFGKGGVSFHHHEVVGARMARERLKALRYPKEMVDDVGRLVFLHLRPHTFKMGWTDSAVRRYAARRRTATRRPQRTGSMRCHHRERQARQCDSTPDRRAGRSDRRAVPAGRDRQASPAHRRQRGHVRIRTHPGPRGRCHHEDAAGVSDRRRSVFRRRSI